MPVVSHEWKNWSGNQTQTKNVEVVRPCTVEELRREVLRAAASGMRIRPVGTAHAWADLIANGEQPLMVIDLQRWHGEMKLDRSDDTATMPAGWRLDEATNKLAHEGYQLNSPPVYAKMNMGGLLGTASHGSGDGRTETMSDHLVGFKMMTPDGKTICVDKNETLSDCEKELLRAVRCSMGALGVVYEISLRVTPSYYVRERDFLVPLQEGLDKLDEIVETNMFVEMFWMPFSKDLWFKAYNRTNPVRRFRLSSIYYWLRDKGMFLFQLLIYPGMLARRAAGSEQWRTRRFLGFLTVMLRIMMGDRVVPANSAFHFQKAIPNVIALAFVVRRDDIVDLWRFLIARVKQREVRDRYPANIMVESRFIRRSADVHGRDDAKTPNFDPSILLSPAVFDETAYVELVGYGKTEGMLEFFQEVERGVMKHFPEARPHWGKYFTDASDLAKRYNENADIKKKGRSHYRMARFLRVREQMDPRHIMSNDFLDQEVFLGGTKIPHVPDRPDLDAIRDCYPPVKESSVNESSAKESSDA